MEIWVCTDNYEPAFFASEEAARLDYYKWCEREDEKFDEETFRNCYCPLNEAYDIWTVEDVRTHGPFTLN